LIAQLRKAQSNPNVQAIMLTGAGGKLAAFAATCSSRPAFLQLAHTYIACSSVALWLVNQLLKMLLQASFVADLTSHFLAHQPWRKSWISGRKF
jgi:hypothetical protein